MSVARLVRRRQLVLKLLRQPIVHDGGAATGMQRALKRQFKGIRAQLCSRRAGRMDLVGEEGTHDWFC